LKLRRAWIPPAVAHAPIVTRAFETLRTYWIHGQTVTWNLGGFHPILASRSIIDELLRRATGLRSAD
jgi:hypothetical protein